MSDTTKVEFKAEPAKPPADQKLPEAKVAGDTKVTVDTTQQPEKKLEQEKPAQEPPKKEEPKPADPPSAEKVEETVKKAGLDMAELNKEFAETGKLSEESYKKLAEAGIPKEQVDAHVEGQKALAEQSRARIAQSVGGEQELTGVLQWAAGLPQPEIDAANKILASGDEGQISLLLQGLQSRRSAAEGREPKLVSVRGTPGRGDVQGYESRAQMVKDIGSNEYKTDPAFRERVARRIELSQF